MPFPFQTGIRKLLISHTIPLVAFILGRSKVNSENESNRLQPDYYLLTRQPGYVFPF